MSQKNFARLTKANGPCHEGAAHETSSFFREMDEKTSAHNYVTLGGRYVPENRHTNHHQRADDRYEKNEREFDAYAPFLIESTRASSHFSVAILHNASPPADRLIALPAR